MPVFVVFYDEVWSGVSEAGTELRKIDGVFSSAEYARQRVRSLEKFSHISFADFEEFELITL